jgi:hypothetical protein
LVKHPKSRAVTRGYKTLCYQRVVVQHHEWHWRLLQVPVQVLVNLQLSTLGLGEWRSLRSLPCRWSRFRRRCYTRNFSYLTRSVCPTTRERLPPLYDHGNYCGQRFRQRMGSQRSNHPSLSHGNGAVCVSLTAMERVDNQRISKGGFQIPVDGGNWNGNSNSLERSSIELA